MTIDRFLFAALLILGLTALLAVPGQADEVRPAQLAENLDGYADTHEIVPLDIVQNILIRNPYQCIGLDEETASCASVALFPDWSLGAQDGDGKLRYLLTDTVTAILTNKFFVYRGFLCTDPNAAEVEYETRQQVTPAVRELYQEMVDERHAGVEGLICNALVRREGQNENVTIAFRDGAISREVQPLAFADSEPALRLVE